MSEDILIRAEATMQAIRHPGLFAVRDVERASDLLPGLMAEVEGLRFKYENCRAAKNLHARRSMKAQELLAAKDDILSRLKFELDLKQRQHANQSYYIGSLQGMLTDFNEIIECQDAYITRLEAAYLDVHSRWIYQESMRYGVDFNQQEADRKASESLEKIKHE